MAGSLGQEGSRETGLLKSHWGHCDVSGSSQALQLRPWGWGVLYGGGSGLWDIRIPVEGERQGLPPASPPLRLGDSRVPDPGASCGPAAFRSHRPRTRCLASDTQACSGPALWDARTARDSVSLGPCAAPAPPPLSTYCVLGVAAGAGRGAAVSCELRMSGATGGGCLHNEQ